MARRKPVPRKKAKKVAKKRSSRKSSPRIRKDPNDEYRDMMRTQGIAKISQLSNDECIANVPGRVSTGCWALDQVLCSAAEAEGQYGIALSRITEIYGPPQIGKSTLLDQIFAQVQKIGGVGVVFDTERSRDRAYTKLLGVDTDALNYAEYEAQQTYIENVLEDLARTAMFWKSKHPDVPVIMGWDALGSTATRDEMEKGVLGSSSVDASDKKTKTHKPGAAAKAMALASRIVAPVLGGSNIGWVFLNHEYENIETRGSFGPSRKSYGGNAPKHMSSTRIQLYANGSYIKRSDGWVMGREVVAKLTKDRFGHAMREVVLPMVTGRGTENLYTVFMDFKKRGIITSSRSWSAINIDGIVVNFQGWNGLKDKCLEIPELEEKLATLYRRLTFETKE